MFEQEYRRAVDRLGPEEALADQVLRRLGEQGGGQPRRLGRRILLAAAVCVLLTASALALSPTLRQVLQEVLGGYAGYAVPVEGTAVENGISITLVSALTDSAMARVYVQARDLTGDRLGGDLDVIGLIASVQPQSDGGISSGVVSGRCVGYEEETGTALLEFSSWGMISEADRALALTIPYLGRGGEAFGPDSWHIEFVPERLPVRTIPLEGTVNGIPLLRLELSVLGAAVYTRGPEGLSGDLLRVFLSDGTVLSPRYQGGSSTGYPAEMVSGYWTFEQPVEPEQAAGIALGQWYIPLEGETAGRGYWLAS